MTFLRTALRLCSGFRPYQEIRDVPFFSSVKYLLKLMTVLALALVLTMIPALLAAIDQFADLADQHLPPMTIEDGRVSTAVDQPYTTGTPAFRIIVDTTGTVTNAATQTLALARERPGRRGGSVRGAAHAGQVRAGSVATARSSSKAARASRLVELRRRRSGCPGRGGARGCS